MNLTISFISEDLVIECVAASYVLPPGDNDMYDDMPELEDYVDVVADLLMVNPLAAHRWGNTICHKIEELYTCIFFMYDDMPVLEDNVDVVADLLMVDLPQNQGSLHGHGFLLQSAASC